MEFKNSIASLVMTSLSSVYLGYMYPQYLGFLTIPMMLAGLGGMTYAAYKLTNDDVLDLFKGLGLKNKEDEYPLFKYSEKTDKGYKMYFTLPNGLCTEDFEKHVERMQQYFGVKVVNVSYEKYRIILELIDTQLEREYKYEDVKENLGKLPILIGRSMDGLVSFDLSKGEPHALIAGESGGGKSTVFRVILTFLVCTACNIIDLYLIDLKGGNEFSLFKNVKNVASFSRNKEEAFKVLTKISKEIDRRLNLFYDTECVDITMYNEKFPKDKLKIIVVGIDEFAELKNQKGSITLLESMSCRARSVGIHMIIATQRPSATVITGDILANIPRVIAMKTKNGTNSRIILDHNGLEKLRGFGHCIVVNEGKEIECQAFNLTYDEAKELIAPYCNVKTPRIDSVNGIKIPKSKGNKNINKVNMEDPSKYDNLDFFDGL